MGRSSCGSYTEIRVDDRSSNVSFPSVTTALPNRHIVGQGSVSSAQPMRRTHMSGSGGFHSSWDGQPPFDPQRSFEQVGATSYFPTYDVRATEHSHTGSVQQYVQRRIETEGLDFFQTYSKDERDLTSNLMDVPFTQTPFARVANANLRSHEAIRSGVSHGNVVVSWS